MKVRNLDSRAGVWETAVNPAVSVEHVKRLPIKKRGGVEGEKGRDFVLLRQREGNCLYPIMEGCRPWRLLREWKEGESSEGLPS